MRRVSCKEIESNRWKKFSATWSYEAAVRPRLDGEHVEIQGTLR
jgi:hypothetical protein